MTERRVIDAIKAITEETGFAPDVSELDEHERFVLA